jgi:hypothetical protein
MFASLRNKFLNYQTCLLHFDIQGNIIIEGFASLRFASITMSFAFDDSKRVYTKEACAVPESWRCLHYRGVYCSRRCLPQSLSCIWTCLHYRGMFCFFRCLHCRGLSCIWTCLHYKGVYCSWRCLSQGLSCIWTCLHYRGMCCFWRCLHYMALSCIWTCLHYRGLWCSWRCLPQRPEQIWMCLHYRVMCLNLGTSAYLLSNVFASLRK